MGTPFEVGLSKVKQKTKSSALAVRNMVLKVDSDCDTYRVKHNINAQFYVYWKRFQLTFFLYTEKHKITTK